MGLILLIDMDGVTVDLHTKWLARYNEEFGQNLQFADIHQWGMRNMVIPEAADKINRYLEEPGFYRDLKPYPGAVDGIKLLHDLGHKVFMVSAAPTSSPTAAADKIAWCKEYLPFLMKYPANVVFTHHKWLLNGDIIFDDYQFNLKTFDGLRVVMDAPYNKDADAEARVKSWAEFVEYVRSIAAMQRLKLDRNVDMKTAGDGTPF